MRQIADNLEFQHTAARRRLGISNWDLSLLGKVSTHSRPKAAGFGFGRIRGVVCSFNTQPPEGGWRLRVSFP